MLAIRSVRPEGSIPACAGEPQAASVAAGNAAVYPRVCGGTSDFPTPLEALEGLSPRVRGNLTSTDSAKLTGRSIPACAGEPSAGLDSGEQLAVYPRVCGGTRAAALLLLQAAGLSPRVRGNPVNSLAHAAGVGSIPACAGEPFPRPAGVKQQRVYPRVCGGTRR